MFIDWIHWLSSLPTERLLLALAPLLLLDVWRYAAGIAIFWACDYATEVARAFKPRGPLVYDHCPSVAVVVAGLNEAATLGHTLASMWDTYPRMEIIVVDDGSSDGTSRVAREFAQGRPGLLVLTKAVRGGKSAAVNFALPFTQAELIVCVDADSHLGENAIWEIVQPFSDPAVGAVSGAILARNAHARLITWLQGLEYLRSIFLGRMVASRLGVLGIVSGAFGAFRRTALERVGGWDVGPGEDGDLTLRLRKAGYEIRFAPYAQCLTNVPTTWPRLLRQRRRWEWAVITFECRKHVDLANVRSPNFRLSNLCLLGDRWLFNIILPYMFWGYAAWFCFHLHPDTWRLLLLYYLVYVIMELGQFGIALYYSNDRRRDLPLVLAVGLMPFYHLVLRAVLVLAVTEEAISRSSFRDTFVPQHVRDATWHW